MSNEAVVSVVAVEVASGKESEFLALAGQMQGLVRRKGYGTHQLLRDGSHPRRYYDIRIWRNADAAAAAERDEDVDQLRRTLSEHLRATPIVDVAWAVEVGLTSAGPWQERRVLRDRRVAQDRRVQAVAFAGPDRRLRTDGYVGPRRTDDLGPPDIVRLARIARGKAHAPYSGFTVGAAIECTDGRIFTGGNIENASYGLTMCAERVALFKAMSEGQRSFRRVAVVSDAIPPATPCGACRQLLWEFAGDIEVVLADLHDVRSRHQLGDLLPLAFDDRSLE